MPLDKCRGEKRALKKLIDHLKECGYTDGKIIIAHNNNEAGALELKKLIENTFGIFNGTIQKTRSPLQLLRRARIPSHRWLDIPFVTINHIKIDF